MTYSIPLSLAPLTNDHGDEACPKALLPIANKPIIEYVLIWLEQSGIHGLISRYLNSQTETYANYVDILIICPSRHKSPIHHHIHSDLFSSSMRIDLQTFDEADDDESVGTCTVLRQFSSRIKGDFVVVPCDFLPSPELPLSTLLNKFRVETVAEGCVALTCWYPSPFSNKDKSSFVEEWGPLPPRFSIIWDPSSSTLLHIDTPDDQDQNSEDIVLQYKLISK